MLSTEPNNIEEKFITGIDTRLNIDKSDSHNEKLQSLGFLSFLEEVQQELNNAVTVFLTVNGHDVSLLIQAGTDINTLFVNDDSSGEEVGVGGAGSDGANSHNNYREFVFLFNYTKANIEKAVVAEGPEQLAHQVIVDEVIKLRAFIESRYPAPAVTLSQAEEPSQAATSHQEPSPNQAAMPNQEPVSSPRPPKRPLEFFLGAGILFLPIIFAWFTLRQGYSWLIRTVAFVWLAVFLFATLPSPKEHIEQLAPAPSVTQVQDAVPPSLSQQQTKQQDSQQDSKQESEQKEKDELHFAPQDLEPQIK